MNAIYAYVTSVSHVRKKFCLMLSYSDAFAVDSENYKKSTVQDHTESKPHIKAYQLYLCSSVLGTER